MIKEPLHFTLFFIIFLALEKGKKTREKAGPMEPEKLITSQFRNTRNSSCITFTMRRSLFLFLFFTSFFFFFFQYDICKAFWAINWHMFLFIAQKYARDTTYTAFWLSKEKVTLYTILFRYNNDFFSILAHTLSPYRLDCWLESSSQLSYILL